MNYYIAFNNRHLKISEEKYREIFGTSETRDYIKAVYRGEADISEVPEEYLEEVTLAVELQTRIYGAYEDIGISDTEFVEMLKSGLL